MKKENIDYCNEQASIREKDDIDALRKVLDPKDTRGVKNSYIDFYLKYYLGQYLRPQEEDTVLEIGCGIGRLVEYLSQFTHAAYGIDISDLMIESCNSNPQKRPSTFYFKIGEKEELKKIPVTKLYIVWVLMLITDKEELVELLSTYRKLLPNLKEAVVLEQVKHSTELKHHGKFYSIYRTIDEYRNIFRASGFKVKSFYALRERYNAPFYKLIHLFYKVLPRALAKAAPRLFLMDKYIMGNNHHQVDLINKKRPTDVVFQLEVAEGKREQQTQTS
jgi:SAM-dependent methyltransferase